MREHFKKRRFIIPAIAALICVSVLLAAFMRRNASQSSMSSQESRDAQYIAFLKQMAENQFTMFEEINSAEAAVVYDKTLQQYEIELSLTADGEISQAEVESYKEMLSMQYDEIILIINGQQM
ncbi:MAG: hypothetical protein K2O06_12745 [Acetatifactor sp.]|nr:hypothetical protein [Acetatifactor sp.]